MCRPRQTPIASCKPDGSLTCFETKEQIALQRRRQEFFKYGGSAELYLFSIAMKKAIQQFRNEQR